MSEIDINRVKNSDMNEDYELSKESLVENLKKANFFVDYFKRKWDKKYDEVKSLYESLANEVTNSLIDNRIETKKDLEEFKKTINKKSENEKIEDIYTKINEIIDKNKRLSIETISLLELAKLDDDEKNKLFFEIKDSPSIFTNIKDENIVKEYFTYFEWSNLTEYYRACPNFILNNPSVIESYIRNTSQMNLNIIPNEYFTYKIEWRNNIEKITTEIINWNSNKVETRIRSLIIRLKNNDNDIKDILKVLLKNENTKNIIEKNLPKEVIENKNIIDFLKENWLILKNNIENNKTNDFNIIANKILKLSIYDKDYNSNKNILIDEIDCYVIKNWIPNLELYKKVILSDTSKIERFSSIIYNKEIALELLKDEKLKSIFMYLSTELRKDKDIIKNTIKDKDDLGRAYFINIDYTDTLVNTYNQLKNIWFNDISIFLLPNFANWVKEYTTETIQLWYKMKADNSKSKKDIDFYNDLVKMKDEKNKVDIKMDAENNDYKKTVESFELILNLEAKNDYEKIIFENLKSKEKTKEFIDTLYNNKDWFSSIDKKDYEKLLNICWWDKKLLKNIFGKLLDKQADIYSNPNSFKKVVNELINWSEFDIQKVKIILSKNNKLSKYINIIKNSKNNEEININDWLLIDDFKLHFKELKKEKPTITKDEALDDFINYLELWSGLWIDEAKLKKLIWGIVKFEFKKVEKKTIAENKEIAFSHFAWEIWDEEYNKIINEKYNNKLEEEWLPSEKNNSEILNNNSLEKTHNEYIETSKYKYNTNSWSLEINYHSWKKKVELSILEQNLVNKNPETLKNIVDFYSTLNKVWLAKLWPLKEQIFNVIWSVKWIWFRIDQNYLSENETKIFLNAILKSTWENTINPILGINDFIANIERKNNTQFSWDEAQVNKSWDTKIEQKFISNFAPRWNLLWFNSTDFEQKIRD